MSCDPLGKSADVCLHLKKVFEFIMEVPFEISSSAIDGIKFLNDVINEETSRKLVVNAVKQILITGPGK